MEKNIIVTDANGNQIGRTYPKRARGLIKSGRAKFVGDCEIRLLQALSPTVISNITEEQTMSKIINFNARDFRFDPDCRSNVGQRIILSTETGVTEAFEIGDWGWNWTQIIQDLDVEPNTEYVFRFAMDGGHNDSKDEICQVMVFPEGGREDRYVFPLERSHFQPILSKRLDESQAGCDTFLRVYDIPFSTGTRTRFRIMIAVQHAVTRFYPAMELSAYADMEDQTWAAWYEARMARLRASGNHRYSYDNDFDYTNFEDEDLLEELEDARDALEDAAQTLQEEMKNVKNLSKNWKMRSSVKTQDGEDSFRDVSEEDALKNCTVDVATGEILK